MRDFRDRFEHHLILKMPVGTATASQIIRGIAAFDAHFEVA